MELPTLQPVSYTHLDVYKRQDFICPDTVEFESDYFRMGDRYGRVIFLREYAAYIKDSMVAELCELNRNMMLSVDIIPVPKMCIRDSTRTPFRFCGRAEPERWQELH